MDQSSRVDAFSTPLQPTTPEVHLTTSYLPCTGRATFLSPPGAMEQRLLADPQPASPEPAIIHPRHVCLYVCMKLCDQQATACLGKPDFCRFL